MSNGEESRLDRLKALAEKILEWLTGTRQTNNSNARSIETLTNKERIARNWLYEAATFGDIQGDYDQRLERMDQRQAKMIELLNRLEARLEK